MALFRAGGHTSFTATYRVRVWPVGCDLSAHENKSADLTSTCPAAGEGLKVSEESPLD